jgi:hypothetical protein
MHLSLFWIKFYFSNFQWEIFKMKDLMKKWRIHWANIIGDKQAKPEGLFFYSFIWLIHDTTSDTILKEVAIPIFRLFFLSLSSAESPLQATGWGLAYMVPVPENMVLAWLSA